MFLQVRSLGCLAVGAPEALVIPAWYSAPRISVKQRGEAVGRLAAHAGVDVLVDGERDGGDGVAQALRTTFTRHAHPLLDHEHADGGTIRAAAGSPLQHRCPHRDPSTWGARRLGDRRRFWPCLEEDHLRDAADPTR
ncbi:hypothetical protein ACI79D_03175 [Geodermatophilus sp. SYSU D00708]